MKVKDVPFMGNITCLRNFDLIELVGESCLVEELEPSARED